MSYAIFIVGMKKYL